MTFDNFADALAQGLFHTIAGRRAVEGVDCVKPIQRDQHLLLPGQAPGTGPSQGQGIKNLFGYGKIPGFVVYRLGNLIEGNGLVGKLAVGAQAGVVAVGVEAEKTEPFGEFHHSAGLGLGRCRTFSHLFFGADDGLGIVAAGAEKYGDVQSTIVDSHGPVKDLQFHGLHPLLDHGHGLFRL